MPATSSVHIWLLPLALWTNLFKENGAQQFVPIRYPLGPIEPTGCAHEAAPWLLRNTRSSSLGSTLLWWAH
jgi:hypothetical protein